MDTTEILKVDPSFNEAMFKTKVDNMFIMLLSSIMQGNLDKVRHFLGEELEEKYDKQIKELNDNNQKQMYDELNVKNTTINNITITEEKIIIDVTIISKYMDYIVDKDTFDYISGINDRRVEKTNHLIIEKKIQTKDIKSVRKCPGCGASISVNTSGKCEYCGSIFNQEAYDYVITSIETH